VSESTSEKIGWIGLGQIGTPMALRLVDHPGGLVVCDVVPDATRPFAEKGVEVAADAAAVVAAGATLISVMVRDDAQVREVVAQIIAVAPAGTVVAVHSTIRPETAEDLALIGARSDIAVLDAPVSGGVAGASTGRLAILLGGDAAAIERCRSAFAPLAELVVHFGPAGAGTRAKIARNLVGFIGYVAVSEGLRLAEAFDLDLQALGKVIRHTDAVTGGAGAIVLRDDTGPLPADHWLRPILAHSAALGEKDLDLAVALAAEAGIELPLTAIAQAGLADALGVGSAPVGPEPAVEA